MKRIFTICLIVNFFFIAKSRGQGLTVTEILIAQDSIHSLTFDEQTGWNSKRMLMEKLLKDTTLVIGDSSVANFYNTYKNDNIGLLSKIRLAVDTMHTVDAAALATIQHNFDIMNSFGSILARWDSIVAGTLLIEDTDHTASLVELYADSVQNAAAANDSLHTVIQSAINSRASTIKSLNDGLSSSKVYEQNEIDVNSIYLSTAAIGQPDSLINYSTQLYNIASQCMLRGGPAVAYARSLYFLINDSTWFDDDQICGSPSDTCLIPPMPGIVSGITTGVCGHQFNYSINSMTNVTGYTWGVEDGVVIDSGQGSTSVWVSYPDTFVMGHISVYATNSCGGGLVRDIVITGYPAAPDSISGAVGLCPYALNVPFSTDSVQGATNYTWVVPSGCVIDSGQGTTRIVVDWDTMPGNVIVVASNACGTSDSTLFAVNIVACRMAQKDYAAASTKAIGDIKLYPNPTTGNVTVVYHLLSDKGLLQLFDVTGRMMSAYLLDGKKNRFEFDIADLCCGIFEYRMIDNETVQGQGKLVIIR